MEKVRPFSCHHHTLRSGATCAVENAYTLKNWLTKHREQEVREGQNIVDDCLFNDSSNVIQKSVKKRMMHI